MNKPQYYEDAYTVEFEARIIEVTELENRQALVLDRTYFYPTSGGQPHDTGTIDGAAVIDVILREDQSIAHVLDGVPPSAKLVRASVHWPRRFDHMQQHTGQHILSAAFLHRAEAETIGFHLGEESVTIDLDLAEIDQEQLESVEQLANQIVWQNRPVTMRLVSPQEARALPLRSIPSGIQGPLRLIEIEGFDLTACGGTHVNRTGSVGLIKIVKTEQRNQKLRIEFRCGGRALQNYKEEHELLSGLATSLTTSASQAPATVSKLQQENKSLRQKLKKQEKLMLEFEAEQLAQSAQETSVGFIVATTLTGRDVGQLRVLGSMLCKRPRFIVLLGSLGAPNALLFCRAPDADADMLVLLRFALDKLGSKSGGGNASFAQGVAPNASEDAIASALKEVQSLLLGKSPDLG